MNIEEKIQFIIDNRINKPSIEGINTCKQLLQEKLNTVQLFEVLYNYQIISYYVLGKEKTKDVCLKFINQFDNYEFYQKYLSRKNNIDSNFKFCDIIPKKKDQTNDNYVLINITAGLGNQLAMLFNGINYCLQNNYNYKFNFIKTDRKSYFDTLFKYYYDNQLHTNLEPPKNVFYSHHKYKKIPIFKEPVSLEGYYLNYSYFKENFNTIKNNLNRPYYEPKKNTICLHFRYGDYKIGSAFKLLNEIYYCNCLTYLKNNLTGNYNIIYFWDKTCPEDKNKIEHIINILKDNYKQFNFIEFNENLNDYEELFYMASCEHNILANSTYSWWAALFNENENKKVLYPIDGFKFNTYDFYLKEWIGIKIN